MTQGPVVRDRKDVGDADDVVLTVHACIPAQRPHYSDSGTLAKRVPTAAGARLRTGHCRAKLFKGTWVAGEMFSSLGRAIVTRGLQRALRTERRSRASRSMKEVPISVSRSCCRPISDCSDPIKMLTYAMVESSIQCPLGSSW
jgi:hypothetical protein